MTLISDIDQHVEKALHEEFPDLSPKVEVTPATSEKFGHYQCNSAMKLAKEAKKAPREIAATLAKRLENPMFAKIEVAGPGFINLTLDPHYMGERLTAIAHDPRLGIPLPQKKQRIIVEFSSPNIAKEMHVGHLRSTIIGDSIARLFEFLGHDVLRLNHVGDWGTAFGMLIAYMREEVKDTSNAHLPQLMEWYRASKEKFDADEAFKQRSRQAVVALQAGEAQEEWEQICQISREAFQEIYDILDIHLQERGESFYNPELPNIVADLEKKGLITVSEGAKCVFHEGFRIPLMVQKSDGGYNYDTTDMAAMLHRVEEEKADRIIVVTDAGQSLHFDLICRTAEKADYYDPEKMRFDHVTFGVVLGEDGKKFKTRSGDVVRLADLLDKAVEKAHAILKERGAPEEIAPILGIDAVKYADLSCNRVSDYVFSFDRMLRFEGNTAAFILYSYVRVNGIKRKIGDFNLENEKIVLEHPSEIDLGLTLLRFHETLEAMEKELYPHYLTEYLYILAQKFNSFFRDCRVEGVPEQNRRLLLCECTARTMERGLTLLGLKTVDRM
ncbi:MAG: arginine--tRNA ligase [Chlamydiales bacterium]|nr:arginine--tRNA ligase [Chlamydiales bacterium]